MLDPLNAAGPARAGTAVEKALATHTDDMADAARAGVRELTEAAGRNFDPIVDKFGFSRVFYGNDALSAKALSARMEASGPNRNLAVFEYLDESGSRVISEVFENEPGGLHSEVMGINALAKRGIAPGQITKVFTELAPCGAGSAGCRGLMRSLRSAKVSYAFSSVAEKQAFFGYK